MAARNSIKDYVANAYYHLYNRGVGKMEIFKEEKDYVVFLHYLRIIFTPIELLDQELNMVRAREPFWGKRAKSLMHALNQAVKLKLYENVELLSFSLMPNHFHLLIYQKVKNGIEMLMRRLATSHSVYFAGKYEHVGPVFCRPYKASHLYYEPELQALAAARYIERNPFYIKESKKSSWRRNNQEYPFSSLRYYLSQEKKNKIPPVWLRTKRLQNVFSQIKSKPNGRLEEVIARHKSLTDFILSEEVFSLEDVRLEHVSSLNW